MTAVEADAWYHTRMQGSSEGIVEGVCRDGCSFFDIVSIEVLVSGRVSVAFRFRVIDCS